jgi:anaerobic selenocysteine-containing dehydrogenase
MSRQPLSPRTVASHTRLRGASVTHGVCPYCAVGCSQLSFAKDGEIVAIEGDPRSPVNEGRLCPKGANTLELVSNPHRPTTIKYRAPRSDHWEDKPITWAVDRIAQLMKQTRDASFAEKGRRRHREPCREDGADRWLGQRQRRGLPRPQAPHRWPGGAAGREPSENLTLLHGVRSGHLGRSRSRGEPAAFLLIAVLDDSSGAFRNLQVTTVALPSSARSP